MQEHEAARQNDRLHDAISMWRLSGCRSCRKHGLFQDDFIRKGYCMTLRRG